MKRQIANVRLETASAGLPQQNGGRHKAQSSRRPPPGIHLPGTWYTRCDNRVKCCKAPQTARSQAQKDSLTLLPVYACFNAATGCNNIVHVCSGADELAQPIALKHARGRRVP